MTLRSRLRVASPRSELAKTIGISEPYAHELADKRAPSMTALARAARKLGMTPEEVGLSVLEFCPPEPEE